MNTDDLTLAQGNAQALALGLPPHTAWKRIWTPEPISEDRVIWRIQGPVPPGILLAYNWVGPPSPTESQFPGYYLDIFGPMIDWPTEANPPRPYFRIRDDESGTWVLTVLKLLSRAEHAETGVWARLSCDFQTGKQDTRTGGYRGRDHRTDDEIAAGARRLLVLDRARRGKRHGDGALWPSPQAFINDLESAAAQSCNQSGHRVPDPRTVSRHLNISLKTLYKKVPAATGCRWPEWARDFAMNYGEFKRNRGAHDR